MGYTKSIQTDTVIELVELACRTQAMKLDEALKRLFADPDEEAVHDVRVACRRTRVILNISEKLFRKRLVRAVQRRVKALLSSLGDIRDAEVFSLRAHQAVDGSTNPRMAKLAELFDAETELRRIHSVAEIERQNFVTLPRLIMAMAMPAAWEHKKIERFEEYSASRFALEVISEQLREISKYAHLNGASKSRKLHSLRIEFKKLRYAAEFAEPAYTNGELKPLFKFGKQMQEVLGKLQDTSVAQEKLTPWLRRYAGPANSYDQALRELVHLTQSEAKALREQFGKIWSQDPLKNMDEFMEKLKAESLTGVQD